MRMWMRGRFWGLATALAALVSVFAPSPVGAQSTAILGIAKAASVAPERNGSFLITYDLRVANLGSAEIRDVAVEDDLAAEDEELEMEQEADIDLTEGPTGTTIT